MRWPRDLLSTLRGGPLPSGSLVERAVKGGLWAAGTNVGERLVLLGRFVVLATVLPPSEFGLLGIALLVVAIFERLSDLGLDAALVQRAEDDVDDYLDTALAMRAVRGAALLALGLAVAPLAADFFGDSRLTDVIRVLALSPFLFGLQNPGMVYLQKELDFRRKAVYRMTGAVVDTAVAVGYTFVVAPLLLNRDPTVWALVFGVVAGNLTRVLVSYVVHDYRPGLGVDVARARELVTYGKWMTGLNALVFLVTEGDDIFVGWALGSTAVGFYQMAYRFSNAPATEITHVVSDVVFPTYSKLQNDAARLREAYFRTLQLTTFVAFPVAVGVAAIAPTFVLTVFGPEWEPAIDVMRVLAVFGLLRSLGATTGPLFQAVGRPDLGTKVQFGKLVVLAALVVPLTDAYGLVGTALAVVGASVCFSEPVSAYLAVDIVDGRFRTLARVVGYPAVASALMAAVVVSLQAQVGVGVLGLAFLVASGVVTYAAVVLLFELRLGYDMRTVARTLAGGFGN
ncbi:lipopolysaccharide biosynthesis protein [Halogeometricum limi]|uniref:Polysaccharide transporter, PST family n=1 Tax=Halogeometricum limi TaxID=555875 RepID=A0A1I6HUB0_9EURY|nr:lipopolysaccharide biosynthesis protein [Halogeometricum limi]SFR57830.1 polysaccharide transporter, PST family [Halogeometricum limi]